MKRALAGLVLAMAAIGCRSPTEIRVEVSTDVPCSQWKGSAIAVGELGEGLEQAIPSTSTTACDDDTHVGTVVLIPSGSDGANVAIKVVGAVDHGLEQCTEDAGYAGCIVARRSLHFIPHETLTLAVPMEGTCKDVPCTKDETCVDSECHSATIVDPTQCEDVACGVGALPSQILDGGARPDATVNDAGVTDGGTNDATVNDGESDAPVVPSFDGATVDAAGAGCGESCAVTAGDGFSCVVRDGGVLCWGSDNSGETGNGVTTPAASPNFVQASAGGSLAGVQGIVSGESTSCAFLTGGGAACWGASAPLGVATDALRAVAAAFLAGAPLVTIANYHMCWQEPGGALDCQCEHGCNNGSEYEAYAGNATGAPVQTSLAASPAPGPFKQLVTDRYVSCVLTSTGEVYCLGFNDIFEVDPNQSAEPPIETFTRYPKLAVPALEVETGANGVCVRTVGHVYCWGQAGVDDTSSGDIGEILYGDGGSVATAVSLSGGTGFYCARLATGNVACWGDDTTHQLGRGESVADAGDTSATAALVVDGVGGALSNVAAVAAGTGHACAMKNDGTTWCWGDNKSGELGQDGGGPTASSVPLRVAY